ncbi:response regulator [Kovacikia minuta CCNUW1]|uniref:hybrid sensor histidine kinase/response regulator n=1 Tax=Kovacikia minuta TaxID=2931930 RepID=UPI001CCA9F7B|nr:response regulator [Kovacikia minuta]UBF26479.1 response regulator [Kovacikia minuta CCNUW1]
MERSITMIGSPLDPNPASMPRILVVEDEYVLAMSLQESLESLGYAVPDILDSAEAAIEKALELRPDLVLMDIRLRGEADGIQAAEYIWNELQIPVIYLTGHSDRSTVERATQTLPFGYLLKPIKDQELYVAIKTALSRCEREQFLSTVLRGMGDGVLVVDPQLRVKYLNRVAETLTGWLLDEARDRHLTEVFNLVDERTQLPAENPLSTALQQGSTIYINDRFLLIRKDGDVVPVTDSATPLRDTRGRMTGAVLVFRDDTRRRLLEERNFAVERANQQAVQIAELERLNQVKDDFLATTSHELRTPLSNIKLAIHLLEEVLNREGLLDSEAPLAGQNVGRYVKILRDQCDKELGLINDLLDMRAIDADAYPLEYTPIQLQDWLPHLAERFYERATTHQQTLQVNTSSDLPPVVSDLQSLTRIVSELLNNACKYTPPGGAIVLSARVVEEKRDGEGGGDREGGEDGGGIQNSIQTSNFKLQTSPPTLLITVSNSGVEIPPAEQARIFDPFYRIPKSDPWKHGGTGLGLALIKKLAEHLGASLSVSSGRGSTTFALGFPLDSLGKGSFEC